MLCECSLVCQTRRHGSSATCLKACGSLSKTASASLSFFVSAGWLVVGHHGGGGLGLFLPLWLTARMVGVQESSLSTLSLLASGSSVAQWRNVSCKLPSRAPFGHSKHSSCMACSFASHRVQKSEDKYLYCWGVKTASALALCCGAHKAELCGSVRIYGVLGLFALRILTLLPPPPWLSAGFLFTLCDTFPMTLFPS